MLSFKIRLALLAVLLVQVAVAEKPEVELLSDEWLIQDRDIVVYDKALAKTARTILIATCVDKDMPSELSCSFVLDKYQAIQYERKNFTCDLKITAPSNRLLLRDLQVEKFEVDSIFFSWSEKEGDQEYLRYGFMYMPYCKLVHTGEVKNDNKNAPKFIMYRNTFDVLDYDTKSCGAEVCRLSHTQGGNPMASSEIFPDSLKPGSILPVQFDGPSAGFFAVTGNQAVLISEQGQVTPLLDIPEGKKYWYPRYAYERFGLCYDLESNTVQCLQIDFSAKKLMDTPVSLNEGEKIVGIFNMNYNGMLILSGLCADEANVYTCTKLRSFNVRENGQKEEPYDVPLPDFDCKPRPDSVSVDIKQNGITDCFHFAGICELGPGSSKVIFSRRCIQDINLYKTSST